MTPVFIIVAGVNGAGKSTFYQTTDFLKNSVRINADEILREHGWKWQDTLANQKAMKIEIKIIKKMLLSRTSFHIETTLAGNAYSHIKRIKYAKELGYKVILHYIALATPELAIKRVKARVLKGGHGVDENLIYKRYYSSLTNLSQIKEVVDQYFIWDNSNQGLVLTECQ